MLIKTLSGRCQSLCLRKAAAEALSQIIVSLLLDQDDDGSGDSGEDGVRGEDGSSPLTTCSPLAISLAEVLHIETLPQASASGLTFLYRPLGVV